MAAPATSNRVNIFSDKYMCSLIKCPVKNLQTSVLFENDIPAGKAPEQSLGRAIKVFYDSAIYQRTLANRLRGQELIPRLQSLNVALGATIQENVRNSYRLGNFTQDDYLRVMTMRQDALHRGHKTAELNADRLQQTFWGSNRQLLFGKVVTDIFAANCPAERPLHLLGAIFCSPCGGIIGPDTHNWWAERIGKLFYSQRVLNYHSVCHDASGYCRNALDIGAGYTYIGGSLHVLWALMAGWALSMSGPARSAYAGQIDGCKKWKSLLNE